MLTKKLLYSRGPLANLSWGMADHAVDVVADKEEAAGSG